MDIYKKCRFEKPRLVIMGISDTRHIDTGEREIDVVLRCLPDKKFFCYESNGTKTYSSYKRPIYWVD